MTDDPPDDPPAIAGRIQPRPRPRRAKAYRARPRKPPDPVARVLRASAALSRELAALPPESLPRVSAAIYGLWASLQARIPSTPDR